MRLLGTYAQIQHELDSQKEVSHAFEVLNESRMTPQELVDYRIDIDNRYLYDKVLEAETAKARGEGLEPRAFR